MKIEEVKVGERYLYVDMMVWVVTVQKKTAKTLELVDSPGYFVAKRGDPTRLVPYDEAKYLEWQRLYDEACKANGIESKYRQELLAGAQSQ